MADVVNGFKNLQNVSEQLFVDRLVNPLSPFADVIGIGTSGYGRRQVRMAARELKGQFGDVDTASVAKLGRHPSHLLHLRRILVPTRKFRIRQQPGRKRTRIHHANAFCFKVWHNVIDKTRVLKRVLVVRHDAVEVRLRSNRVEHLHRVAANPNTTDLACLLSLPDGRNGFFDNLR